MTTTKAKKRTNAPQKSYFPAEKEVYMSEAQLIYFTNILTDWKDEIIEESERTRLHLKDNSKQISDLNDRATQEEEFSLELRARDRERKLLHKINKALERIATNNFGYCQQCGEEIGVKRLEARPTAELCIDCKQLTERKERGFTEDR